MSILLASGGVNGLTSSSNLSNVQSFTKLIWMKMSGSPTGYTALLAAINSGITAYAQLYAGTGTAQLALSSNSSNLSAFPSQPTFTNWNCYAFTGTTAAAGSLIGYWQDNAGVGFVSQAITGVAATVINDYIAGLSTLSFDITAAYYKEWNTVLTPTQLQAEYLAAAPVISGASLRRYLPLVNAATAGTDTSGNSFNMSAVGAVADGVGLPTFPSGASRVGLLTLGCG